ncbi:hypothetical protein PR048_032315 [Dryococelus australis]|uniref:Uncharacterized protein n=1 Tax=Dryococelus australis TaxID=614101 RepID=A0ABQ9G4W4_9NEOP|nr:hypothetical protein PR048_032315 [Dryococelus australis]
MKGQGKREFPEENPLPTCGKFGVARPGISTHADTWCEGGEVKPSGRSPLRHTDVTTVAQAGAAPAGLQESSWVVCPSPPIPRDVSLHGTERDKGRECLAGMTLTNQGDVVKQSYGVGEGGEMRTVSPPLLIRHVRRGFSHLRALTKQPVGSHLQTLNQDARGIVTTHSDEAICRNPLRRPAVGNEHVKQRTDIGRRHSGREVFLIRLSPREDIDNRVPEAGCGNMIKVGTSHADTKVSLAFGKQRVSLILAVSHIFRDKAPAGLPSLVKGDSSPFGDTRPDARISGPANISPGFSQVGIVPDDAVGRSSFPRPCIPTLLHSRFISPSSALKTSSLNSTHVTPTRSSCLREYETALTSNLVHVVYDSRVVSKAVQCWDTETCPAQPASSLYPIFTLRLKHCYVLLVCSADLRVPRVKQE